MVVLSHTTLSLKDLDADTCLVVSVGREALGFPGRNRGVSWDNVGHYTTSSLDTLRKGSNVEQHNIFSLFMISTIKNGSLNCSSVGNSLIRVDLPV